ncbi:MAG: D-alanyl-D-alanine carboxypeptidase family protein [Candidatus Binatia bacterium]
MSGRWRGLVVVGSVLLLLGQSLHSEGSPHQSSTEKPLTSVRKDASKSHLASQTAKLAGLKQSSRSSQKSETKKATSSEPATIARSSKPRSRSRRSSKRATRKIAPKSSFQPSSRSLSEATPPLPPPGTFAAVLLTEAETGEILFALNDHREWPTASLAKMMVALLTFEAIERGELSLSIPILISKRASQEGGRKIHLRSGEEFPLEELLRAMMVTSANDAAVAIAEHLYGSVEACVAAMNRRARQLGMRDTLYRTPNGLPLPDGTPPDISSAADQTILARTLARHSLLLEWTSLNRVPFREGRTSLPNTNHLVGQVPGVDGLKTGFTAKARFNLVTTAQRGALRLIAVVLGGRSSSLRFSVAANLLEWGFTNFTRMNVIKSGKPLGEVRIEKGSSSTLRPIAARGASLLVRKEDIEDLKIVLQLPSVISAPIARDQIIGQVVVRNNDQTIAVIPAISPRDIPRAHWFPARH